MQDRNAIFVNKLARVHHIQETLRARDLEIRALYLDSRSFAASSGASRPRLGLGLGLGSVARELFGPWMRPGK